MTTMRSFQLHLLTILICLFTIIYPYEAGTIITPFFQMEETKAQKAIKCT